jgi:N4-gp56 family major capsid protein
MAATIILRGTDNSALVPKYWSTKFLKDSYAKDPTKPFYGAGIIMTEYNLKSEKGDTIEVPIVGQLTGSGVGNDGDYDSTSDALPLFNMPVRIYEHGNASQLNGIMTEKSSALRTRTLTMEALTGWRAAFNVRAIIDSLSGLLLHKLGGNVLGATSGLAKDGSSVQIGCVTQVTPAYTAGATANRYYAGGQVLSTGVYTGRVANISSLNDTNYAFGTKVIEDVKRMAEKTVDESDGSLISPIEKVVINGKPVFVMLITPKQGRDLKADTNWRTAHESADIRGMENSIFAGTLGIWDGVMIVETDLLHARAGANGTTGPEYFDSTSYTCASGETVNRALFLGKNAVAFAIGKAPEYAEFYADHAKTKWKARVTSIYGVMKVCKYESTTGDAALVSDSERGCIIVDTAVA